MVGPNGDQVRVVVAFIDLSEDEYKMQSMIIDLTPVKNREEQPSSVQVDLTTTVRSLSTGEKKQKILLLRWNKTGEIELRCSGKWVKQDTGAVPGKIIEAIKAVIQNVPLDTKAPTDATLPQEVEQKVSSALNALNTEALPCIKDGR
jgi:hypothetical protein